MAVSKIIARYARKCTKAHTFDHPSKTRRKTVSHFEYTLMQFPPRDLLNDSLARKVIRGLRRQLYKMFFNENQPLTRKQIYNRKKTRRKFEQN